jgi:hypothetical protein
MSEQQTAGLFGSHWRNLLRRMDYLTDRLAQAPHSRLDFDRGEASALKWALAWVAQEHGGPEGMTLAAPDALPPEVQARHVEALRAREEYLGYRIAQYPTTSTFDHSERQALQRLLRLLPER